MPKNILILGAGLVTKPMVDYLANHGYQITLADIAWEKAEKMAAPYHNVLPIGLDSNDLSKLNDLIEKCDLAVSLLPAVMHPTIADFCLKHSKNMVTASYISPAMRQKDKAAQDAGITILNEVGVDPGIDHMSAVKVFHDVRNRGGKIVSFMSYCGGLPAPEADTNPLGYKFSWSPKGVLMAAGNSATYLKDNKIINIEGSDLFSHYWLIDVPGAGCFEAYPNRDSMNYIDLYDLKHVRTMYRGTLRKIGHCDLWFVLGKMGFFLQQPAYQNLAGTVRQFILEKMLNCNPSDDLRQVIATRFNLNPSSIILKKMEWLGFFDDTPLPIKEGAAIDVLTMLMLSRMQYAEGERDLLVMHHEFIAEFGSKEQRITSTMVDYGIPGGDSSMARTVSLPAAIGVHLILQGKIDRKGVIMPVFPDIYNPILDELANLGIQLEEKYY
jgi:saccharopine dehydrogenase-like NADP-dependent oxidoreductase